MPTLKETEVSLSCVQCFLYLVSSSVKVSIFHIHGWIPSGQTIYNVYIYKVPILNIIYIINIINIMFIYINIIYIKLP